MRGTDDAAIVASGWDAALATILDNFSAGRIAALEFMGRSSEGYTQVMAVAAANGINQVTVLDISGRGILMSVGGSSGASFNYWTVVIDGSTKINDAWMDLGAFSFHATLFMPFTTSCLVTMRLNEAGASRYFGCAVVE